MLIAIRKSNGALLTDTGGAYYGQPRPDDSVPVRSSVPVAVRFYDDNGVRVLLDAGQVLNLDIKPQGKYDQTTFTLPSPAFTAPTDPTTGDYVGLMSTLVAQAEAVLDSNNLTGASPDAIEPDDAPLMAQVSWGLPNTPWHRSDEWTVLLVNVVRHDGEGVPTDADGPLTVAVVETAVAQAAAATAALANLSGATVHTFLDDASKLEGLFDISNSPVVLKPGDYAIIASEGYRVEQFLPIVPASLTDPNYGVYTYQVGGYWTSADFANGNSGRTVGSDGNGGFVIEDVASGQTLYTSTPGADPTAVTWSVVPGFGSLPLPDFTALPLWANQTNWIVLQNTVYLTISNQSTSDFTINGVNCDTNTSTDIGWIRVTDLIVVGNTNNYTIEFASAADTGTGASYGSEFYPITDGDGNPVPTPLHIFAPRGASVIVTANNF